MKLPALLLLGLTVFSSPLHAEEITAPPSVFYSCTLQDLEKNIESPNQAIDCGTIILQVVSKLDGQYTQSSTTNTASIVLTIGRVYVNQEYQYSFTGEVRNAENTRFGPFPLTIDGTIDANSHLNLALDAIEKVLNALKLTLPPTTGNDPESTKLKNWYFELKADGSHRSNGSKTSNTSASFFSTAVGIYGKNKIQSFIFSGYNRIKQPITATDTFKGNSYSAGWISTYSHSLGNKGEPGEKWSFALISVAVTDPYSSNLDFKGKIAAGVEWNLVPYRVSSGGTSVIVRTGVSGFYHNYRVQNILLKDQEGFASAFAKLILVWYSKNERVNITAGLSSEFRLDKPEFGDYSANGNLSIRASKKVTIKAGASVTYKPKSITDQNPEIPLSNQSAYFYSNYPGISTKFSGGIAVTLGKNAFGSATDMRWKDE